MNLKKLSKTGEDIYEELDSCFDRHCSSCYNMKPEEVPGYEAELSQLNSQKWVKLENAEKAVTNAIECTKLIDKAIIQQARENIALEQKYYKAEKKIANANSILSEIKPEDLIDERYLSSQVSRLRLCLMEVP
jgi:hypothetical protein